MKQHTVLIPPMQFEVMRKTPEVFLSALEKIDLKIIPDIGETDGMKKHPLALHYFLGGSDWYIAEWDKKDLFFGYAILNGDLENSEWGYIDRKELLSIPLINLDLHCFGETIEKALFNRNREYFYKYGGLK